jgi:hypothetical protein
MTTCRMLGNLAGPAMLVRTLSLNSLFTLDGRGTYEVLYTDLNLHLGCFHDHILHRLTNVCKICLRCMATCERGHGVHHCFVKLISWSVLVHWLTTLNQACIPSMHVTLQMHPLHTSTFKCTSKLHHMDCACCSMQQTKRLCCACLFMFPPWLNTIYV